MFFLHKFWVNVVIWEIWLNNDLATLCLPKTCLLSKYLWIFSSFALDTRICFFFIKMSPISEQREVRDLGLKLCISNPRKGVKFLVEKNILSENPTEIVRFILKYWGYINLHYMYYISVYSYREKLLNDLIDYIMMDTELVGCLAPTS